MVKRKGAETGNSAGEGKGAVQLSSKQDLKHPGLSRRRRGAGRRRRVAIPPNHHPPTRAAHTASLRHHQCALHPSQQVVVHITVEGPAPGRCRHHIHHPGDSGQQLGGAAGAVPAAQHLRAQGARVEGRGDRLLGWLDGALGAAGA